MSIRNKKKYEIDFDGKMAANKRHKEENPDYYRIYHQNYYQENKVDFLKQSQDRYSSLQGRALSLHNSAKRRAAKMRFEFLLTLARIQDALTIGTCERTNIVFDLSSAKQTWRNPYADDNIQIVVNLYNTGKGQHTDNEFIEFCHMVALNNPRQHD